MSQPQQPDAGAANGHGQLQTGIASRAAGAGSERETLMQILTESDLTEDHKSILSNLVVSDAVLAKLSEERLHELVWKTRITRERFFGMFPPRESEVVGDFRKFVNDDPDDNVKPLSTAEKERLRIFFDLVETRFTRARDGWQQEILSPDIQEGTQKVERPGEEDSGGGLLGLR